MDIETFREYCLAKPGTTEGTPFDEETLVFKVGGKMFALTNIGRFEDGIALKCDPEVVEELRERYPCVLPGYHMSKKHWNTVLPNSCVPDTLLLQWVEDSYRLVADKLPKAQRLALGL